MSQSLTLEVVWKSFQHDDIPPIRLAMEKLIPLMFVRVVWIYDQSPRPLSVAIADGLDELALDGADPLVEVRAYNTFTGKLPSNCLPFNAFRRH